MFIPSTFSAGGVNLLLGRLKPMRQKRSNALPVSAVTAARTFLVVPVLLSTCEQLMSFCLLRPSVRGWRVNADGPRRSVPGQQRQTLMIYESVLSDANM